MNKCEKYVCIYTIYTHVIFIYSKFMYVYIYTHTYTYTYCYHLSIMRNNSVFQIFVLEIRVLSEQGDVELLHGVHIVHALGVEVRHLEDPAIVLEISLAHFEVHVFLSLFQYDLPCGGG